MAKKETHPDEKSWLEARHPRLTASEAAAALGLSPWKTPRALYEQKRSEGLREPENEAMAMGKRLEPVVAQIFSEQYPFQVVDPGDFTLYVAEEPKWLAATPDRILQAVSGDEGVLEIKTTSREQDWDGNTPPLGTQVQVQHQLATMGLEWGYVAVLILGRTFRAFPVERNQPFIDAMLSRLQKFYEDLQQGRPPGPTFQDLKLMKLLHPEASSGKTVELSAAAINLWEQREAARKAIKQAEEDRDLAEARLRDLIGDAEIAVLPDGREITAKTTEVKGFTKVVDAYSYRALRLKRGKA